MNARALPLMPPAPQGAFAAVVEHVRADGLIEVRRARAPHQALLCEVLQTSPHAEIQLAPEDRVLVMPNAEDAEEGFVLGKLGAYQKPKTLEISSGESLTLRCGDGTVHLRADGKVEVRGMDVVTKAARRNRIKGGSVEIN